VDTDPDRLTRRQRIALARVTGIAERHAFGSDRDEPREEAVTELRLECSDPVVLGVALGHALTAQVEHERWPEAVEQYREVAALLVDAGADRSVAGVVHAAQVARYVRRGHW